MQIGMGNLAVGRIVEAHINARHLIARYGSPGQKARAAHDGQRGASVRTLGHRSARATSLRMTRTRDGIRLDGGKMFCSAAGFATRALVTARMTPATHACW